MSSSPLSLFFLKWREFRVPEKKSKKEITKKDKMRTEDTKCEEHTDAKLGARTGRTMAEEIPRGACFHGARGLLLPIIDWTRRGGGWYREIVVRR